MTDSASFDHCEQVRDRARYELATALDRIPFQRAHALILVLIGFGTLLNAIEEYNVGFAAPLIAGQWSLSKAQVGLLTRLTFAAWRSGRCLLQLMFILLNTTTFVWAPELYPTRVRAFGTGAAVTVLLNIVRAATAGDAGNSPSPAG